MKTCDTPRERPQCAPAHEPDVGDEVKLKSDRDKVYVVKCVILERDWRQEPNSARPMIDWVVRYRVRHIGGFTACEHEVTPAEIEINLPTADLPIAINSPDEDVLDHLTKPSADPFATVEQATIALDPPTGGAIEWERADARGEVLSRDGRFMIVKRASLWQAFDFDRCQKSFTYGERADAASWCELQVKIDAITSPLRNELGSLITPPPSESLAWDSHKGVLWSTDGRFSIHSLDSEGSTVHFALDHESSDSTHRHSPNGTEEQSKTWCEKRSHYRVVTSGGEESLVPREDLGEVTF